MLRAKNILISGRLVFECVGEGICGGVIAGGLMDFWMPLYSFET